MRCINCRVDLNENATRCPLCGGGAQDVPPLIQGVAFQDYPVYARGRHSRAQMRQRLPTRRRGMTLGEQMRARFHL